MAAGVREGLATRVAAAVAYFEDDFKACIAHLRVLIAHRRVTRTTNLLERLFGEERRRTKVIPHAFGDRAEMKLMFAAIIRASQIWRGVLSEFERRQLAVLREELDQRFDVQLDAKGSRCPPHEISLALGLYDRLSGSFETDSNPASKVLIIIIWRPHGMPKLFRS